MKHFLTTVLMACLFISCNRNHDEGPVCQLRTNAQYLYLSPYNMQFPNAFTPNGDGRNDRYHPLGNMTQISDFRLTILDKDGSTLFETTDTATTGWDGHNSVGGAALPGRYVAKIYYKTIYNEAVNDSYCIALLSYGGNSCIPQSVDGTYYFEDMYNERYQGFIGNTAESLCM